MPKLIVPFFILISMGGWSQSKTMIYVDGKLSEEEVFVDSIALKNYIESTKIRWINEGFLFSGLDSLSVSGKTPKVYLHKGNASDLSIAGIKGKKVEKSLTKLSKRYSNSGYPFAQLRVDSITYKDNFLRGLVKVEEGPLIRYDSAFFYQNPKTNHSYIYQLLAITPGELFSERSYATIADKIQRSPFLSLQRATDLSFSSEKAKIYLDLKEQTTNSFQGVLGLQQNPSGGSRVVGSLDLEVQNLFRSGHEFHFNWESFAANSQRLNLYYKHAFPFKAKFSPSFVFTLLKQDTTFVTRTTGIGVNTFIGSSVNLSLDYEATSGSLIASEAETVGGLNLADYRQNLYQIEMSNGFESMLNSYREGIVWKTSLATGTKQIERNASLPAEYYDTLELETNFLRVEGRLTYQLKIGKRQTLHHDIQVGLLENRQILTNELYRLGGLTTLRGFDEKNFFASQYGLSRLELRSFFENESYLYVFYDQLIFKRFGTHRLPAGIGLGFGLDTSSGQFSFALATGRDENQRFSISQLRAHFGFITRF